MKTAFKSSRVLLAGLALVASSFLAPLAWAEGKAKSAQKDVDKMLGASSPSAARQSFGVADRNNDGVVSLDEFHKDIVKSWRALDLDGDGEITRAELESIPDRGALRAMLRLLQRSDLNNDMKLSFKELVEARMAFFDEADVDRDDRLTLAESLEFEAKQRPKAAAIAAAKAAKAEPAPAAGK